MSRRGWRVEGSTLIVRTPEQAAAVARAYPGKVALAVVPGSRLLRFGAGGRVACRCCGAVAVPELAPGVVTMRVPHADGCEAGPLLARLAGAVYGNPTEPELDALAIEYERMSARYTSEEGQA